MPIIHYIDSNGGEYEAGVLIGSSAMQGAVDAMIDGIKAECRGKCRCGTCHCYVDESQLKKTGEKSSAERAMLAVVNNPLSNSRLSCQIEVSAPLDGLIVRLPESQI